MECELLHPFDIGLLVSIRGNDGASTNIATSSVERTYTQNGNANTALNPESI